MDNFGFSKHVLQQPKKNNSVLEEIRAKDIYTVHSPDSCPTLPGSLTSSFYQPNDTSFDDDNNVLSADNIPPIMLNSKMDSLYVVFEDGKIDRQPKMKKISIGTYQNLPAVMEEDVEMDPNLTSTICLERENDRPISDACNASHFDFLSESDAIRPNVDSVSFSALRDLDEFAYSPTKNYYENYTLESDLENEESWVDLSSNTRTPPLVSHPGQPTSPQTFLNGEEYLRLLREAQKESNQSSARVSHASSRRDSPRDTPRSPPNSPNTEMVLNNEEVPVKEVLINYYNDEGDFVRVEKKVETDWLWHWSSRPDQEPPKNWNFTHSNKVPSRGASLRKLMIGSSSIFSREVLYTLLLTNVLSFLIGSGIGMWFVSKKSGSTMTISTLPLN